MIKKIPLCSYLLIIFVGVFSFVLPAFASEKIDEFYAEYTILSDGTVQVVERIRYDFGLNTRRGLERTLTTTHAQAGTAWYKRRFVTISNLTGSMISDTAVPYRLTTNDNTVIQIAYARPTVRGVHDYEIRYTLLGALSYDDESAELYWNVTGNQWAVPIQQVTAVVYTEAEGMFGDDMACYQGKSGITRNCTNITAADSLVTFTAQNLRPGEELTIGVGLNRDTVVEQIMEEIYFYLFSFILGILWLVYLGLWVYRVRTKDKLKAPKVTQYEPYAEYPPMYTGVLYNGRLDSRDIVAGLVYLAQQGFLTISRKETKLLRMFTQVDFELTLNRPISEASGQFLPSILRLIFRNPTVSDSVLLSQLNTPKIAKRNQKIVRKLRQDLQKDMRENNYFIYGPPASKRAIFIVVTIQAIAFGMVIFLDSSSLSVVIPILLGSLVLFAMAYADRYTKKGRKAQYHLEGFKHFLSMTEAERYTFHNSPEKNTETFMKYLPYAIAFGVEKKWADTFKDITIQPVNWYRGTTAAGAFQAAEFTSSLSSFSNSFSNSSASSGSTGSSGGGRAGGGGGGGGGRSL